MIYRTDRTKNLSYLRDVLFMFSEWIGPIYSGVARIHSLKKNVSYVMTDDFVIMTPYDEETPNKMPGGMECSKRVGYIYDDIMDAVNYSVNEIMLPYTIKSMPLPYIDRIRLMKATDCNSLISTPYGNISGLHLTMLINIWKSEMTLVPRKGKLMFFNDYFMGLFVTRDRAGAQNIIDYTNLISIDKIENEYFPGNDKIATEYFDSVDRE